MKIQDAVLAKLLDGITIQGDIQDAIDMAFCKALTTDDLDFQQVVFNLFLDSSRENIRGLIEAFEKDDNEKWHFIVHNFKGTASSLGAFSLSKKLEYAEHSQKEDKKAKADILQKIKEESAKAILCIESFLKKHDLKRQ
jgi:HPt (histidine-containing phosphotransfer) domain-containing protein